MKKCGVTEWYLPVSGPVAVSLSRKLGLDGIQLGDLGGHHKNYPLLDERIKAEYFEAIGDSDFTLYSYHPASLIKEVGMKHDLKSDSGKLGVEIFKKSVQICKEYNIPTILLAEFAASKVNNEYELKKIIENFKEYKLIADDNGIRITCECFSNLDTMLYMREAVGDIYFCYDVLNPIIFGFSDPKKDLDVITIDMIDHIHVKDTPENMKGSWPLGEGVGDVKNSISRLSEMGFDGWYFLENHYNEMPLANIGHGLDIIMEDKKRLETIW